MPKYGSTPTWADMKRFASEAQERGWHRQLLRALCTVVVGGILLVVPVNANTPLKQAQGSERRGDATFAADVHSFAIDLLAKDSEAQDRSIISPVGLAGAFTILRMAAAGQTAKLLEKELPFLRSTAASCGLLSRIYQNAYDADSLNLVAGGGAAVWVDESCGYTEHFRSAVGRCMSTKLGKCAFKRRLGDCVRKIEEYTSGTTDSRIAEIASLLSLNSQTALVILSTLHFKAPWKYAFDEEHTSMEPFYPSAEESTLVRTMRLRARVPYYSDGIAEAIELPYKPERYSLIVAVPKAGNELSEVASAQYINATLVDLKGRERLVDVSLPAFDAHSYTDIADRLSGRELTSLLCYSDLSQGIVSPLPIRISSMIQLVFFEVAEGGTEGAAATGITGEFIENTSPDEIFPLVFRVNRPFVFLLKDSETGLALFLGMVINPGL